MHRILFSFDGLKVYSWGFMVALGIIIATIFILREAEKKDINPDNILNIGMVSIFCSLIGARIYYVIEHHQDFANNLISVFYLWDGGLVFYGGLIGFALAFYFMAKHYKINLLTLADLITPFLPLAYAVGRIGCFLNGCCYGIVANTPISVVFADANVPGKRIPTQLIDSFVSFLFFIYLYFQRGKEKFIGDLTTKYLIMYSISRFLIEFLRDEARIFFGLTHSQVFSIILFIFAIILRNYLKRKSLQTV
ncbi:Prolipoprotein diacylglyceryl transferase [Thermodesulfobium narugense DSM 14796]|uniref:Phosphatidylglycerol--prolipoprotein diacylglyceryl transferase n=1 Tax=Thermodesulfobium narugense DSM 14796 TaxID=747365 RepID=M1E728_9BACT|nr:prolipoprotein diacylglyceryl transferase [Thermodesulfobium narugense]AEE14290.1 Prolipoprotein diacylglyceryl transferase [Thermodesulfobium narugense DSM 14796]